MLSLLTCGCGKKRGPEYSFVSTETDVDAAKAPSRRRAGINSRTVTACILIGDVIGIAVLALPGSVAQLGWLLGSVLLLVVLAVNVHISVLLWRVCMKFPEAESFVKLADCAFSATPGIQGRAMSVLTEFLQQGFSLGALGMYMLIISKNIGMLFYDVYLCLPIWTAAGIAIVLPVVMASRNFGSFPALFWINIGCIAITICTPLIVMAWGGLENSRLANSEFHAIEKLTWESAVPAVNTIGLAFSSQIMLVEIIDEMADPSVFPSAYYFSSPFQAGTYILAGVGGYYFLGNRVTGMLNQHMPFDMWFRIVAVCLIIHTVVTVLLRCVLSGRVFLRKINHELLEATSTKAWVAWVSIVSCIIIFASSVAQLVPFFDDFIDLVGATFGPTANFMLPIIFYVRCMRDFGTEEDRISLAEKIVIGVEFVFSILLSVTGTYFAIVKIGQSWHTYGMPFACHCEEMWNTCRCSPSHAGLQQCETIIS